MLLDGHVEQGGGGLGAEHVGLHRAGDREALGGGVQPTLQPLVIVDEQRGCRNQVERV